MYEHNILNVEVAMDYFQVPSSSVVSIVYYKLLVHRPVPGYLAMHHQINLYFHTHYLQHYQSELI